MGRFHLSFASLLLGETTALAAESFCDIVRDHARTQGDVIAFTYGNEELSFAEIDAGANRVANGLAALGVKPGDRVAVSAGEVSRG